MRAACNAKRRSCVPSGDNPPWTAEEAPALLDPNNQNHIFRDNIQICGILKACSIAGILNFMMLIAAWRLPPLEPMNQRAYLVSIDLHRCMR